MANAVVAEDGMTLKRKILYGLGALVLAIAGMAAWMLGPALLPPQSIEAGIAKGGKAPITMPLQDSKGAPATLASAMGEKGLVLILVRSADWCPFCKAQMVRTEEIREEVAGKGYGLASLSYDKPAILADFAASNGLGYTLLSDVGSKMIDALDLRDPQYAQDSFAYGVPRASILVIAPDGTVRAKYIAADYRSRPPNEEVLGLIE